MTSLDKAGIIAALGLRAHFEGGYFRETFRPEHRAPFATAHGRAAR